MAHKHSVYDTDLHFSIDPLTRGISNHAKGKTIIIQHDHNSERFTFEVPRYVDGHDMSLCNVVQVHYLNIEAARKDNKNAGIYEVDDLQISPDGDDVVILSWLISGNATKYVGSLNFVVRFSCVADDGTIEYAWNTALFSGIAVSTGIFNTDIIVEDYADVLLEWEARIAALEQGGGGSGGNVDLTGYATEQYVKEYSQPKGDYLTNEDKTELEQKFDNVSWNNLEDKPFGEETAVLYENPEIYLDMGEANVPIESNFVVVGETYDVEINGEVYSCVCAEPEAEEDYGLLRTENLNVVPWKDANEDSLYLVCNNTKLVDKTISLKISGTNTKTLDTKYLPKQLQFGNEETTVLYENTTLYLEDRGDDTGEYYEKFESSPLSVGETYDIEVNGIYYSDVCTDGSMEDDGSIRELSAGDVGISVYRNSGKWTMNVYSEELIGETISLKISHTGVKKLDSKYLPDVSDIPASWIAALKTALGI